MVDANVPGVSMGNDTGRGDRSNEPRRVAGVRHLHLDDIVGSNATATDEWYETERFAGQITGRAHSRSPADRPDAQKQPPAVLDWRHAEAKPPPATALQRLKRGLEHRSRRRGHEPAADTQTDVVATPTRGHSTRRDVPTASQIAPPTRTGSLKDEPPAAQVPTAQPSEPRLGFREPSGHTPERHSVREHKPHADVRRWALITAAVLGVAAVSVVGIASETNSPATKPHKASLVTARSRPDGVPSRTVMGVVGLRAHQVRKSRIAHRAVQARRHPRHKTRGPAGSSRSHQPANRSKSAATTVVAPASTPSTRPYPSSSSSPAYSPQPAASEPAVTATTSTPQPAGPTGPGGTVGSNCNPKCS